jgi:hypothetical protein
MTAIGLLAAVSAEGKEAAMEIKTHDVSSHDLLSQDLGSAGGAPK